MGTDRQRAVLVEGLIRNIRGKRVVLDVDLARIYGVSTKRLNEQVQRNIERFPDDFMFRSTEAESEVLGSRSQNATLKQGGNIKYLPYAFTEHGYKLITWFIKQTRHMVSKVSIFNNESRRVQHQKVLKGLLLPPLSYSQTSRFLLNMLSFRESDLKFLCRSSGLVADS